MALSRVSGKEDIYISGIFAFRKASLLEEHGITHVLSVIKYSLDKTRGFDHANYTHLSIDIDDVEEADILVHLPKIVRFIESGLYGPSAFGTTETTGNEPRRGSGSPSAGSIDAITPAPPIRSTPADATLTSAQLARLSLTPVASSGRGATGPSPTGAVLVHCAMGRSRSVTAVIAYLLWKYPQRFGAAESRNPDRSSTARSAVLRALKWVRETRGIAEPNEGFMQQLELWWDMGCPAGSDDAVEKHRTYRRWAYRREVEEAAKLGMAPDRLVFQDEEEGGRQEDETRKSEVGTHGKLPVVEPGLELRCKKCRRVLATKPFIVPHSSDSQPRTACPHLFIEPLSWMRPILEEGALDGRLVCPGTKCGASIGRYAWQGFKCSCGEWVCPAFSLQRSKVDEVATSPPRGPVGRAVAGEEATRMAALGIRLPPRLPTAKENL